MFVAHSLKCKTYGENTDLLLFNGYLLMSNLSYSLLLID